MVRSLLLMFAVFTSVVVLAEISIVGLLWSRGYLTTESLRNVRLALGGATLAAPAVAVESEVKAPLTEGEIRELRVRRILELEARENELSLLKRMTTETANRLISDRQSFDQLREEFRKELEAIQEQTTSAATEQTRTILLASPPEEAVKRLMGLTVEEGIELLRGLPEKSIARILQNFQLDPQTAEHGQLLFEGIYRGEPNRGVVDQTLNQLNGAPTGPAAPTG